MKCRSLKRDKAFDMITSCDWEWGNFLDTAFSFSVSVSLDQDVSLDAPSSSPGVLDSVIFLSVFFSVSDCQNTVVKSCSAHSWVNTTLVQLEGKMISFNGDWNWLLGNWSNQSLLLEWGDISTVWNSPGLVTVWVVVAWSTDSSVWVLWLSSNSVVFDIPEGLVHQTSVATVVSISWWAVNQLLFWEWIKALGGEEVCTFQWTGGWKGPAWTALTLVLYWSDGSLCIPVDFGW